MIRRELRFDRSREVEQAIIKPPTLAPVFKAITTRPDIIEPLTPSLVALYEKAITRPKVTTAVGKKVEDKKFSEGLLKKMLQNVQTRNTKLPVRWKSPDIKTGVIGKIAPMPVSLGWPQIPVKYPIGTPQRPPTGISPPKEKELKAGKLNVIDKFFLWINALLK